MEIKKEITVNPMTTDGKILENGDEVVFIAEGKSFVGIYLGINKRGAVMFSTYFGDEPITFNVMPRSIAAIYKARIEMEDSKDER